MVFLILKPGVQNTGGSGDSKFSAECNEDRVENVNRGMCYNAVLLFLFYNKEDCGIYIGLLARKNSIRNKVLDETECKRRVYFYTKYDFCLLKILKSSYSYKPLACKVSIS